jgi:hypothetical protein
LAPVPDWPDDPIAFPNPVAGHGAVRRGAVAAASEAAPRHVEIAAGPMDDALKRLALQARLQLLYEPDVVSGRSARALRGEYSPAMPCGSCWPAAACGLRRQARESS